jgi:hypothetical protein
MFHVFSEDKALNAGKVMSRQNAAMRLRLKLRLRLTQTFYMQ